MEHNYDGVLMFLYFEKASVSIEWNILSKTLKLFNFWDNFLSQFYTTNIENGIFWYQEKSINFKNKIDSNILYIKKYI